MEYRNGFMLAILCTGILGCSPVFSHLYDYSPLKKTQLACGKACEENEAACVQKENEKYDDCENSFGDYVCFDDKYCSYQKPFCPSPDYSACIDARVSCHMDCGGSVIVTTKCVKYCEDVNLTEEKTKLSRP
jgi:hypothetical protein